MFRHLFSVSGQLGRGTGGVGHDRVNEAGAGAGTDKQKDGSRHRQWEPIPLHLPPWCTPLYHPLSYLPTPCLPPPSYASVLTSITLPSLPPKEGDSKHPEICPPTFVTT